MTNLRALPMINVSPTVVDGLSVVPDLTVLPDFVLVESTPASRHVMGLLAGRVPLSLLFDLADPAGPSSVDIASSEMDCRSLLGDLLDFRANAAEGSGPRARARSVLRTLRLG